MRYCLKYIMLIAVVFAIATGCNKKKGFFDSIITDYSKLPIKERFEKLAANQKEWTEINIPIKLDMRAPESISASGRMYMRRGSRIYVSVRFLGFEAVALYADNDSIHFVDKVNKRFVSEPIGALMSGASLSISDVQDLLLGRVFVGRGKSLAANAVKLTDEVNSWRITPKKQPSDVVYSFVISDKTNLPSAFEVKLADGRDFACVFGGATVTDIGTLMADERVQTAIGNTKIDVSIQTSPGSIKWSAGNNIEWRQPKGYKRIPASSLIKGLKF